MNNLTAREKGFMYVITLLIIVVLGYFFGIRTLNDKYDEYKAQKNALEARRVYLDQLRENNASMSKEIDNLTESCEALELSFIDKLETESIEQYILKTYEDAGCPYLTSISSADVGMPSITYPDGTTSPDTLVCLKVTVTYVTTDGYTVPQYNRTPDLTNGGEVPAAQTAVWIRDNMGKGEFKERRGYNEFITATKKINAENKDCIKVESIDAAATNGYLELTATIDFYGVNLRNRLSVDERKDAYTYWSGNTNIDTKGGFIGFPYVCDYEDSLWYGCTYEDYDYTQAKPFASYWANYLFEKNFKMAGSDIKKLIGFGVKPAEQPAEADKKAA